MHVRVLITAALWTLAGQPGRAQSAFLPPPPRAGTGSPAASPATDTTDYSRRYAATITAADLEKHLRVLASDEYEGRETGQKGQKMAAAYIARQFDAVGAAGPVKDNAVNPHFQSFELTSTRWSMVGFKANKRKLRYLEDFLPLGVTDSPQQLKLPMVFAAYGIEEGGASDYAGVEVKGKAVVLLQGEPMTSQGVSRLTGTSTRSTWSTDVQRKLKLARDKGAAAVVMISERTAPNFREWMKRTAPHLREARVGWPEPTANGLPAVMLSPETGAALLGTSLEALTQYRGAVAREGWPLAAREFQPKGKVRLQSVAQTRSLPSENVLGYVEGNDKKAELLVVSAHYDHLGILDGKVYNGADDDGSGTVAVLELAEAFAQAKKEGHGPRRSLLFLTVAGEEKGLLGSEWYTEHPVFPLANTVTDLNIDMIGRLDEKHEGARDERYIYVIGADKLSSDLHRINEEANRRYAGLTLDYTFNDPKDPNQFYYRSDHYNFARKGIPVAFYFNGVHADYHQESDEVSKILFPKMERIARLVFHTAWDIANREERPKVDSNKP